MIEVFYRGQRTVHPDERLEEILDRADKHFGWKGTPEQKAARDRRFDAVMKERKSTAAKKAA